MRGWELVERMVVAKLRGEGYDVHWVEPSALRYGADLYHLFDVLAMNDEKIRLIQVKSGAAKRWSTPDTAWVQQALALRRPTNVTVEWWHLYKGCYVVTWWGSDGVMHDGES